MTMKMGWVLFVAGWMSFVSYGRTTYDGVFAPHEGLTPSIEQPLRQEICLNGLWDFQGVDLPADWVPNQGIAPELKSAKKTGWDSTKIKIPSPWNVNSYKRSDGPDHHDFISYPASWENYKMGWLKKTVTIPEEWAGKKVFIHFEAVAGFAEVYVDGVKVCENFDLFLPFDADITAQATAGKRIEIRVGVRHHSLFDDTSTVGRRIVPAGSMWGQHIVGIWQDVYLFAKPAIRVDDVYVKPLVSKEMIEIDVTLKNETTHRADVVLDGMIQDWVNLSEPTQLDAPVVNWKLGESALTFRSTSVSVDAGSSKIITVNIPVKGKLKLWSPETPNLYGMTISVESGRTVLDKKYQRFGWREWTFDGMDVLLNGKKMELRGDSWHFQGVPQMTRRYAWAWYTAIKDAHGNAVRLHAQVYPRFYMDMADEMGICVLSETANWASDGGPRFDSAAFWKYSEDHLERFILRDRNYPSVIGWSLTNENRPIILSVFNRPDLMPVQIRAWARWVDLCKELDPSRPWISGDGDEDGDGTLPTVIGHYGDDNDMKRWASRGKPWGIGEHSMAYYGTPAQVSKYNGERAFESTLGKKEGLAYECYDLIAMQRKQGATYVSVFNIAWYALQPLELGLADTTRPPTLEDGVFLTQPYVEGKPGIQPERIGTYSTTLNPGYDPALPLYKTWPMFDAIRDANAPGGPAPSPWAEKPSVPEKETVASRHPYSSVLFMGAEGAVLKARLATRGVDFSDQLSDPENSLVFVDGSYALTEGQVAELRVVLQCGGDVLIWGITPETQRSFNELLPNAVVVTERKATSLLVKARSPVVSGLDHSDFYFCEIQTTPVMEHGLEGPFVENGQVVLAACDTDWRRWNMVEESTKTAAIMRSEREAKPAGAAFVSAPVEKGRVMISTLTDFYQTGLGMNTLKTMCKNMGVPMRAIEMDAGFGIFDLDGKLKTALVCGPFGADTIQAAYDTDFLDGESGVRPLENSETNGKAWKMGSAMPEGDFNFRQMQLSGPMENATVYLSFWVWSPRSLDDLLVEPDMPKLDVVGGADDAWKIWLNGRLMDEKLRMGSLDMNMIQCKAMPVKQGWNHFLVKVVQGNGNWQFAAQLKCSDYEYMSQLKAAAENPDDK